MTQKFSSLILLFANEFYISFFIYRLLWILNKWYFTSLVWLKWTSVSFDFFVFVWLKSKCERNRKRILKFQIWLLHLTKCRKICVVIWSNVISCLRWVETCIWKVLTKWKAEINSSVIFSAQDRPKIRGVNGLCPFLIPFRILSTKVCQDPTLWI